MRYVLTIVAMFFLIEQIPAAQRMATPVPASRRPEQAAQIFADPEMLSFPELLQLSSTAKPPPVLSAKLNRLLTTPFVHNDASEHAIKPHRPFVNGTGQVLRIALWNIERGLNFELVRSALTDPVEFERLAIPSPKITGRERKLMESQLAILKDSDIVILNEVDLGMKRTEYRDVARELANAADMNYAYGVEFVEVDPLFDLGSAQIHLSDVQMDRRLQDDLSVDPSRYRGLHGNAILSRYAIVDSKILRLPACYDWYGSEAKKMSQLEQARRWSAHTLFRERIDRELRQGGRMALIVHLAVPDMPNGEVTVVAAHLENKCPPGCRRQQLVALLAAIRGEKNPVILAGDFNTTSRDNTPTSARNEIMTRVTDYRFWISQAASHFHPFGFYQYLLFPAHYFHGYMDPTAMDIPVFWENRERGLFRTIEMFHFDDGRTFDFRGRKEFTIDQRERTLADSDQRAAKGSARSN